MLLLVKPYLCGYAGEAAMKLWDRLFGKGPPRQPPVTTGEAPEVAEPGSVGISFDLVPPKIDQAIDGLALAFCASTNETTSQQLEQALSGLREEMRQGLFQGEPLPELRKRVSSIFDDAEKWRAQRIAASEASRAVHSGEIIAAKESGVVKGKKWLLSADACPQCQAIAAANPEPIPLDASFGQTGSQNPAYAEIWHPPAHPSCQCSETLAMDESALAPGVSLNDAAGLVAWSQGQANG